jgi:hypothetical protein
MSLADLLLIGWWVALAVVPPILFVFFRRHNRQQVQAATIAYLRGASPRELRYRSFRGPVVETLFGMFVILIAIVMMVFFFVIIWMHNESKFYLWSFYSLIVLGGLGLLTRAFAKEPPELYGRFGFPRMWTYKPRPGSFGAKAIRVATFMIGSLMFAIPSYLLVRDVALPWSILEGRIDNLRIHRDHIGSPEYKMVIDGRWHDTTNEVFSTLRIGDRVRAEIGAGSKTIFRTERITTR